MLGRFLIILFIVVAAFPVCISEAQTRRAFIVGVGEYDQLTDLQKTNGDARGYAELFGVEFGFSITTLEQTRKKRRDFIARFDSFVSSVQSGDEIVFVFSGHGWSANGDNYLSFSDAPTRVSEAVLKAETVALEQYVMARLRARSPKLILAIIDACRNENYGSLTRSTGRLTKGIGRMSPEEGELILYSAGAGEESLDRLSDTDDSSPYSVFTRELLPRLREASDRPLAQIADETRAAVQSLAKTVKHDQRPEMMLGIGLNYCFSGTCTIATAEPETVEVPILSSDQGVALAEAISYDLAPEPSIAQKIEVFETFVRRFPQAAQQNSYIRNRLNDLNAQALPLGVSAPFVSPSRQVGSVFRDTLSIGGEGPEMVVIPSGSFTMGSPSGESGRGANEGPLRDVAIDYTFAVGKFELTWSDWDLCVSDGGCDGSGPEGAGGDEGWGKGSRPVINVDWNDAQSYADWLSVQTGESYRLLSEAEWEYVARAGTEGRFGWGDGDPTCRQGARNGANYRSCRSNRTEPVGYSSANGFGLHDLHGNVLEWVEDCYEDTYSGAPIDGSARTACSGSSRRVLRGGSWFNIPQNLRSALRIRSFPADRDDNVGFRLARTL